MSVKGRVVDFRERDAVADHRVTERLRVDLRRYERLSEQRTASGNPDRAHRSPRYEKANNELPRKGRLMKTLFDGHFQGVESALKFPSQAA